MNTREIIKIKAFLGKNNVADAARIQPNKGKSFLSECLNVDIDDEFMPHRRDGYGVSVQSGSGFHSLWSNGEICLVVYGVNLMKVKTDYSLSTIKANAGSGSVSYADVPPKIFLTNENIIGYVENSVFSDFLLPSDMTYKILMPPGQLVEWYHGRLIVARGNDLWWSDAMAPMIRDERRNFKSFPSKISMMGSVADGIWLADQQNTYFLSGADIKDSVLMQKSNKPAIFGTSLKCDSQDINDLESSGQIVVWLSENGVCVGGAQGYFKELTRNTYNLTGKTEGSAIMRKTGNFNQVLASMW